MLPRANYFQGVLQLRDVNDEIMAFVRNQMDKRDGVFVTKAVKLTNGFDFYITSQKFIRILGRKLKESFGGELKVSSKLHTRSRQGKDLYRINVMFRLLKYKAGSVVNVRGEEIRILSMRRKIFGRNLKTGKKVTIRASDIRQD
jgi:NMD protein affecting ribosome stability and mRNA decay